MNNSYKILALIVTYNRLNILKECIDALLHSSYSCDILIIDNNSIDGTKDYLNSFINNKKFRIIFSNTNLNGAGGYNLALKKACKLNYDFIWIMDDDCIVNDDSLYNLLKVHEELNGNYGFLSSKVKWVDGSICLTNIQRKSVARRIKDFKTHIVPVDFCSFVSCFVKLNDVKSIGFPIKDFVIWTDDLEWTRRLTLNKINVNAKKGYLCNDSIVVHKCAKNYGVTIVKDSIDRLYRYKYIYRNDVYCFKREGIRGHLYMFIRNIYHILKILLFAKDNKFYRISILLKGYIEGYNFNPVVEYYN